MIRAHFIHPPVAHRENDWCAYDDAIYDFSSYYPVGYGKTEQEALEDLAKIMEMENASS